MLAYGIDLSNISDEYAPTLFANYERATMLMWRSSWKDNASGVWIRGGHKTDQHDHQDRGHVNLIFFGTSILNETGTPYYHSGNLKFNQSNEGHNVLQIDDNPALKNQHQSMKRDLIS
ncbi:MAG: hypothetical protein SNJ70_05120 [Armatimonadota bacterium]